MRICVVGSGISGLAAAWLLSSEHEVDVIEREPALGGHTKTVDVQAEGVSVACDIGFMVFNHRTYPNLVRLFEHLGVPEQDADMSFSVYSPKAHVIWRGDLRGIFADPRTFARPAYWRMLADIVRFSKSGERLARSEALSDATLGEVLEREGYGPGFRDWYIVPMAGSIWSMPRERVLQFPAQTMLRFFDNHGLIRITGKPQWKSVPGGARRYVARLAGSISGAVRTGTAVSTIVRHDSHVEAILQTGERLTYDAVVLACHADQALAILADADGDERRVLAAVPYQDNEVVLHADTSQMPPRKAAWAAWNHVVGGRSDAPVSVTYRLKVLQRLGVRQEILVTLNPLAPVRSDAVFGRYFLAHPQFGPGSTVVREQLQQIQGRRRTWFAGAWTRYGFHEDGLVSGLAVAGAMGIKPPWGRILTTQEGVS
ncbi:MAG: FAD-dependent oxidoreductase [Coriobacteriia bacterium]|nr:FAD-dependent oxidoreductase [Coriobacteriia bacterium]